MTSNLEIKQTIHCMNIGSHRDQKIDLQLL